jgi:hypothetical protein
MRDRKGDISMNSTVKLYLKIGFKKNYLRCKEEI